MSMSIFDENNITNLETLSPTELPPSMMPSTMTESVNNNKNMFWLTFQIIFLSIFMFIMMTTIAFVTQSLIVREMRQVRRTGTRTSLPSSSH